MTLWESGYIGFWWYCHFVIIPYWRHVLAFVLPASAKGEGHSQSRCMRAGALPTCRLTEHITWFKTWQPSDLDMVIASQLFITISVINCANILFQQVVYLGRFELTHEKKTRSCLCLYGSEIQRIQYHIVQFGSICNCILNKGLNADTKYSEQKYKCTRLCLGLFFILLGKHFNHTDLIPFSIQEVMIMFKPNSGQRQIGTFWGGFNCSHCKGCLCIGEAGLRTSHDKINLVIQ